MVLTTIVLGAGAKFMGAGISESLIIGSALSLSSSAFVLQLIAERKEKTTRYATATFGVLLLQDVAVVPLFVLVPLVATMQYVFNLIPQPSMNSAVLLRACTLTEISFSAGGLICKRSEACF